MKTHHYILVWVALVAGVITLLGIYSSDPAEPIPEIVPEPSAVERRAPVMTTGDRSPTYNPLDDMPEGYR